MFIKRYDLLLIGPCINKKDATKTGGAVVLFNNLLDELNKKDITYLLIDSNKDNYFNIIFAYLTILIKIFFTYFRVKHISLHSSRDYIIFAPFIILIAKIFGKTISLRKFGGEAWSVYSRAYGIKKRILFFIFSNFDFLFFEMKSIVNNFITINKNTFWFPNVREKPNIKLEKKEFKKRFVFISQIFKEKGVDEILEASLQLPKDYVIDLYGPIKDNRYGEDYFKSYRVHYGGALNADEVLDTLSKYDVLLLPTYYKGEGYPGIVIESYSIGVPIIVTNLKGLSEITDNKKTGVIIEPKNVKELVEAILYFNSKNYQKISQYALEKFSIFNSYKQTKIFLNIIQLNI